MGQAKHRGSKNQRIYEARLRPHERWSNVTSLVGADSDVTPIADDPTLLRIVFEAFVEPIGIEEWFRRRDSVEREFLEKSQALSGLVDAPTISFQDAMAWYLYLCELAISKPYEMPTYYSSRILPFLAAIGSKLQNGKSVSNIREKFKEAITKRFREPDGHIFEILVALSYAEMGWAVKFIPEGHKKSADILVTKGDATLHVECKRLSSRSSYAVEEEAHWREQWSATERVLRANGQWIWLDVVVHREARELTTDWLASRLATMLPIPEGESCSSDDSATIRARRIDKRLLNDDLAWSYVKASGSKLRYLLGQDWVPENATTSLFADGHVQYAPGQSGYFASFFSDIDWASGATFTCDAEASIERKARDVKTTLARAAEQVPDEGVSVVHIAFETLEGPGVEERRMKKLVPSIEGMTSMKSIRGVVVHSFQPVDSNDQAMVIDETFSDFWRDPTLRDAVPLMVVLPATYARAAREGNHWTEKQASP